MSAAHGIIIELDGQHVRAVAWKTKRGGRVAAWSSSCVLDIATESADPAETAQAIKTGLGKRFPRGGEMVLLAPRSDVAVKPVRVPKGVDIGSPEARSAVILAARAQNPFGSDESVVSVDPVTQTEVNAYSIRVSRLTWFRELGRRLGARRAKVLPRAACFSAALPETGNLLTIVVAEGAGSFEVGAKRGPHALQARSRPLPSDSGHEIILNEVNRVWTSVRLLGEDLKGASCVVLGFDGLAQLPAQLASSIGIQTSHVSAGEVLDEAEQGASVPAAAAVSLPNDVATSLDFVESYTPTVRTDPVRAVAMCGVFLFIIAAGGGYLWVDTQVRAIDREIQAVKEQNLALSQEYLQHLVRDARLQHHTTLGASATPISEDLAAVARAVEGHDAGVRVSDLSLTRRGEVEFFAGQASAYPGTWRYSGQTRIRLGGDLGSANRLYDFRERLLRLDGYDVDSLVPDGTTEFRFDLVQQGRGGR